MISPTMAAMIAAISYKVNHRFHSCIHQLQRHHHTEKSQTDTPLSHRKPQYHSCDHYENCHCAVDLHIPLIADAGKNSLESISETLIQRILLSACHFPHLISCVYSSHTVQSAVHSVNNSTIYSYYQQTTAYTALFTGLYPS